MESARRSKPAPQRAAELQSEQNHGIRKSIGAAAKLITQLPRCLTSPSPHARLPHEQIRARKKPRLDPIIKNVAATTNDVG
jgi:hypothetical protein